MPDLDLCWPSSALAEASAEVLAEVSSPEGSCAPSDGDDAR